jgi:hypothetical protein
MFGLILGGSMVSSLAIVEKIRQYLGAQMDLRSFREWMVESHLEMQNEKSGPDSEAADQDAARLLAELEGRYAELSEGTVPEQAWRRHVAALISPQPQSAESFLLTFFYVSPSGALQLNSTNMSDSPYQRTGNPLNTASNYKVPETVAA